MSIVNNTVNSLALTVLPDAPVDPATGLKVPTIAVATAGGISVIQDDGAVRNSSTSSAFSFVTLSPEMLTAGRGDTAWYYALNPGNLGASFALSARTNAQSPDFNNGINTALLNARRSEFLRRSATASTVQKLRNFESDPAKGLAATISNLFSTGHQPGDIRRTYLSDTEAGSVTLGSELVTNGTFDIDLTGWTAGIGSPSVVDGEVVAITTSSGFIISQTVPLTPGKTYKVTFEVSSDVTLLYGYVGGGLGGSAYFSAATSDVSFTAVTSQITLGFYSGISSFRTHIIDNVSIKEVVPDRSYKASGIVPYGTLTRSAVATDTSLVAYEGFSAANYLQEPYSADLDFGTGEWGVGAWANIPTANASAATIACREYSSGAYIRLGVNASNQITATAHDGTTTRIVTTSSAYNNATWLKPEACYTTDGTLSIRVNGVEVAATRGDPLLTLNNSDAVLTIGNSYALDAPFPGKLALLKLSATVPTQEQSIWMYEQEKQLFREGAKCVLPDSGGVVDLAYDDATDKWIAASATNISEWSGLIRTNVIAAPVGSYSKLASGGGVTLQGRITTSPGVDVTIPAYNLREELVKRAEAAARLNANLATFDYNGGFTANTTDTSTAITSVAGLLYPASYIGATVTGSGIPADTVVSGVSGTTIYLSKPATATATGVQIAFTDFALPVGYEAKTVSVAGALKQEGATKDFTRLFDGFKETVRFGAAPAYDAWVQIQATRSQA